jgi:hypothetical protein
VDLSGEHCWLFAVEGDEAEVREILRLGSGGGEPISGRLAGWEV